MSGRDHRGTIFVEDAELIANEEFPGRQFVIRLRAPKCAAAATPGSFAHLTCDPQIPMRRPLSIQRVDRTAGWVEILYKIVGPGLAALAQRPVGATISIMGPIGSGKSATCCVEAMRRSGDFPEGPDGSLRPRGVVVRNTYPDLKSTTLETWFQWIPRTFGKVSWAAPITHIVRTADMAC